MPRPLNYFDNGFDPTLPSEIKPFLYRYDEYQTHDLIYMPDLPSNIGNSIETYFNNHNNCCISILFKSKYILLDRFTPQNIKWAENYTKKIYELASPYAASSLLRPYTKGTQHPEKNDFDFGIKSLENQYNGVNWYELTINIDNKNNKDIATISWLDCDTIANDNTFIKRSISIKSSTILHFYGIQPCSMVVESDSKVLETEILSQIPNIFLYKNIDQEFDKLKEQVENAFPYERKFVYKYIFNVHFYEEKLKKPTATINYRSYNLFSGESSLIGEFETLSENHFREIPENAGCKILNYANNNIWNNKININLTDIEIDTQQSYGSIVQPNYDHAGSDMVFDFSTEYLDQVEQPEYLDPSATRRSSYNIIYGGGRHLDTNTVQSGIGIRGTDDKAFMYGNVNEIIDEYLDDLNLLVPYTGFVKAPVILVKSSSTWDQPAFVNKDFSGMSAQQIHQWILDNSQEYINVFIGEGITSNDGNNMSITGSTQSFENTNQESDWVVYPNCPPQLIWEVDFTSRNLEVLYEYDTQQESIEYIDEYYHYPEEIFETGERTMPDSVRVKETHEFIKLLFNPDKHCYDTDGNDAVFTLGDQIDLIAQVLGISFYRDGSIKSIRQRKNLKSGTTIPSGYGSGQFEIHTVGDNSNYQDGGISGEERIGIQYDNISNNLKGSVFDPDSYEIENGDYVLCENLLQYFQAFKDDLDKALALQEMSAGLLPSEDGTKICSFEGMGILVAEVAWMLSKMSRDTSQTLISSLITQAVGYELLKATGLPLMAKSFKVKTSEVTNSSIVYPAVTGTAPNNLQQFFLLLENIAPILAYVTDILESDLTNLTENGE